MAAVIAFDRRASHFVGSKTEFVCDSLDVQADSDAATSHLQTIWNMARNDRLGGQAQFIRAVGGVNECLIRIRAVANGIAGRVEAAPEVDHPDQLALWVRPDRAVVSDGKTAA